MPRRIFGPTERKSIYSVSFDPSCQVLRTSKSLTCVPHVPPILSFLDCEGILVQPTQWQAEMNSTSKQGM